MAKVSSAGKSGEHLSVVHLTPIIHVRLGIDPADPKHKDDTFTLSSASGKYKKTKTVKDDTVPADEFVDLVFDHLIQADNYTLEISSGGSTEKLFENVPYQELVEHYSFVEEDDGLEEEEKPEESSSDSGSGGGGGGAASGGGDASQATVTSGANYKEQSSAFDPDTEPEDDEEGGIIRNPGW